MRGRRVTRRGSTRVSKDSHSTSRIKAAPITAAAIFTGPSPTDPSAEVALDLGGPANLRVVRVHAGGASSPPLMQEIPGLIQHDLELLGALSLGVAGLAAGLALPQIVLLGGQPIDLLDHGLVVHVFPPSPRGKPRYTTYTRTRERGTVHGCRRESDGYAQTSRDAEPSFERGRVF